MVPYYQAMDVARGKTGIGKRQLILTDQERTHPIRRVLRGSSPHARVVAFLACFLLVVFLASCGSQKSIIRPTVQVNNTNVITNTMYIGEAFASPEHMVSASLMPKSDRLPTSVQSVSFIGIIAQDTQTLGCSPVTPCDVLSLGMFRQKDGTFRYGYQMNGAISYAKEPMSSKDYRYNIDFFLNEEGPVNDPDYPHQRRFGYEFHVASGIDDAGRVRGLQSSLFYGDQIFVGVMDEGNNVNLPTNKHMLLNVWASSGEQAPDVIYTNEDQTSQVSSQYSDADFSITLTLSGSSS